MPREIKLTDIESIQWKPDYDEKEKRLLTTIQIKAVIHESKYPLLVDLQKGVQWVNVTIFNTQDRLPGMGIEGDKKEPAKEEIKPEEEKRACASCQHEFTIAELAAAPKGLCPNCGRPFLPKEVKQVPAAAVAPGTVPEPPTALDENKNGDRPRARICPKCGYKLTDKEVAEKVSKCFECGAGLPLVSVEIDPHCAECQYVATKEELDAQAEGKIKVCPKCGKPLLVTISTEVLAVSVEQPEPPKKKRGKPSKNHPLSEFNIETSTNGYTVVSLGTFRDDAPPLRQAVINVITSAFELAASPFKDDVLGFVKQLPEHQKRTNIITILETVPEAATK